MNYITYILKFLYRIRLWLILCPLLVAFLVYLYMGRMPRYYRSQTTVYTGIVSGYDIEYSGGAVRQDWNVINNAMDNLINIIKSQATLYNVSMRLYARVMSHGNPDEDNNYIQAKHYRGELARTPQEVIDLIVPGDEEATLQNLYAFEEADHDNHVYGLFRWTHRYYSYYALSQIKVSRMANSDMLEISYENDDPGIVYQTLLILNEEFVDHYKMLRFGETSNVIAYFEAELARIGRQLRNQEDSLLYYNIRNRVINYEEQTKQIAALSRDYELHLEEVERNYESSSRLRKTIENQLDGLTIFQNNAKFLEKLHAIKDLNTRISTAESFQQRQAIQSGVGEEETGKGRKNKNKNRKTEADLPVDEAVSASEIDSLRRQLGEDTRELRKITNDIATQQYTKEGVSVPSMIEQWLEAMLLEVKSEAELNVLRDYQRMLDKRYTDFSPVGSTLKRQNRAIGFTERTYLSILEALNEARLREKNLQMTSATLRIINPPTLPISAEPTKRKQMVAIAFVTTFFFVLFFFILMELLDHTLRDKFRTERITGGSVLGAYPGKPRLAERRYIQTYRQMAVRQLTNAVMNFFHEGEQNVINLISTEGGDGKTTLMEAMAQQLRESGMTVRTVSWNCDFDPEQRNYLLATKLSDFAPAVAGGIDLADADVVLVEHPAFDEYSVPKRLLQEVSLNLLVVPANRTWKDTDQILYDKAVEISGETPLSICLNAAQRSVVQNFTGLMPPYTRLRRLSYQISQFGFTATK